MRTLKVTMYEITNQVYIVLWAVNLDISNSNTPCLK